MTHNFTPEPNREYNVLLENGKKLVITFTEDNDIYEEEEFCDFENFECYDNDDNRYVCYIKVCSCGFKHFRLDCDTKDYIELKNKDMDGNIHSYKVSKIE